MKLKMVINTFEATLNFEMRYGGNIFTLEIGIADIQLWNPWLKKKNSIKWNIMRMKFQHFHETLYEIR